MNINIKQAVSTCPLLTVKENVGERHRIMHSGIRRGSLWIQPRRDDFRVLLSGEVDSVLGGYMRSRFGPHKGEDQGKKYWYLDSIADIESVIEYFGTAPIG
ncbi:MAG: hypothetical protein K9M02_01035 [Thiohalocapsa sp.]|nr:hypothetical protein [Thiohalocapsa sp.]